MEFWRLLMEILLLLGASLVFGAIAQQLRQSAIVGYLVAGTVLGPLLFNPSAVSSVAELGVSLLLFSIGLEFSFRRLRRMGAIAIGGGTVQVLATWALFGLLAALLYSRIEAFVLGAVAALSSTAVVLRVLADRAEVDSVHGRNALGILLMQDIAVVPMMLMVSMLGAGGGTAGIGVQIAKTLAAAVSLVAGFYLVFYQLVPRFLQRRGHFANRELVVLLTIVSALGSTWTAHALGISPAMGAFLAGIMIAESPFATQIRSDIGSLRTLFVTLFFTSIGMVAEPAWILRHLAPVAFFAASVLVFKTAVIFSVCRLFKVAALPALATGIALSQVGEFSFVLAAAARQEALVGSGLFSMMVSVTILLMFLAPYTVAYAEPLAVFLLRRLRPGYRPAAAAPADPAERFPVFLIGYGPAARGVAEALARRNMRPAVVELNPGGAERARQAGLPVFLGDARSEEVLAHAGIAGTCIAVVTVPDPRAAAAVVENVRRLSPEAVIVARSRYNVSTWEIEAAGATRIVDEEIMVGRELAGEVEKLIAAEGRNPLVCALSGPMQEKGGPHSDGSDRSGVNS